MVYGKILVVISNKNFLSRKASGNQRVKENFNKENETDEDGESHEGKNEKERQALQGMLQQTTS